MLAVLLPLLVLGSLLALAAWLDVRRGARMPVAAGGAFCGLLVGALASSALRTSALRDAMDPARHVLLACLVAACVGVLAVAVRALPPRFPFTLAVLSPAVPLLALAPTTGHWPIGLAGALAAATWPWALAHGFRGGRADKAVASVALLALVLASPPALLISFMEATEGGGGGPAEHAWTLDVEPEGDGAFVLRAPFFVASAPRGVEPLDALRATLRVTDGEAEARLIENGSVVEVRGRGPVRVEARHAFYGPIGLREAFHAYHPTDAPFVLTGDSSGARVTWHAEMSGGRGHTCWASGRDVVDLRAGEPTRGGLRMQAVCA